MSKVIAGRRFFFVAPGAGTSLQSTAPKVLVAWDLDRSDC